jgi:hypothetical protein
MTDRTNNWIPVSERVPTEDDARRVKGSLIKYVDVTTTRGTLRRVVWNHSGFGCGEFAAWRPLPAPYVPPEPEKRERVYRDSSGKFHNCIDSRDLCRDDFVRVCPGDPDPTVVLEVMEHDLPEAVRMAENIVGARAHQLRVKLAEIYDKLTGNKAAGRLLDGETWDQFPEAGKLVSWHCIVGHSLWRIWRMR